MIIIWFFLNFIHIQTSTFVDIHFKIFLFICCIQFNKNYFSQITFNLEANQSMLMYGKGKGQDGAINPFAGKDCYALIKNKGKKEMYIRVQQNGLIIKSIPLLPKETKKVDLPVGYELYFDGNELCPSKVELEFGK